MNLYNEFLQDLEQQTNKRIADATRVIIDDLSNKNIKLQKVLIEAKEKLIIYRHNSNGIYNGGIEHSELIRRIELALIDN